MADSTGTQGAAALQLLQQEMESVARRWAAQHPDHVSELQAIKAARNGQVATSDRLFLVMAERAWCEATGL